MATKSFFSGARFDESMYSILIGKTFDDSTLNCFSIGIEYIDTETGNPVKMQSPSIPMGDFDIVSNFNTDIQPLD